MAPVWLASRLARTKREKDGFVNCCNVSRGGGVGPQTSPVAPGSNDDGPPRAVPRERGVSVPTC
jgi:hypothetical protein